MGCIWEWVNACPLEPNLFWHALRDLLEPYLMTWSENGIMETDEMIVAVQWSIISHFVVLVWAEVWMERIGGCGNATTVRSPWWPSRGCGILFSQHNWFFIWASRRAGQGRNCSLVWQRWHLLVVSLMLVFHDSHVSVSLHHLTAFLLCFYSAQKSSWA